MNLLTTPTPNDNSSPTFTLKFEGTKLDVKPAPVVATFLSRGLNPSMPELLKPDFIAPGLNILAAWTVWLVLTPHVAGIAALLKGVHPNWSPDAIRSALITTCYTLDNTNETLIDEWMRNQSTVMDFGVGHVNPHKTMDLGLIYDLTFQDYVAFLSPFKQRDKANITAHFDRTVTNVGDPNSVYKVTVTVPGGTSVSVKPNRLAFKSVGEKLSFHERVEAEAVQLPLGRSSIVKSGSIVWLDGEHVVNSPLVVTIQCQADKDGGNLVGRGHEIRNPHLSHPIIIRKYQILQVLDIAKCCILNDPWKLPLMLNVVKMLT
ncbi:hypothetical protein Leryth_011388 [Lithospermum erythrorhizon]|nr:hypothetical protein Leryth_011388 [Lithospermum erythrorhizon]